MCVCVGGGGVLFVVLVVDKVFFVLFLFIVWGLIFRFLYLLDFRFVCVFACLLACLVGWLVGWLSLSNV